MTDWRLADSLVTLRNQINQAWPDRNKASDGTIGDAAHQAVSSDHNPNAASVVCALDITNNPPYFDAHALADQLLVVRHPDLKYLISNQRIAGGWTGWQWTPYSGTSDPHINHIHISVGVGDDGQSQPPYDDTTPWNVTKGEESVLNEELVNRLFITYLGRPGQPQDASWIGKPTNDLIITLEASQERKNYVDARNKQIADLQTKISQLEAGKPVSQATIDSLAKQADNLEQAIKAVNQ